MDLDTYSTLPTLHPLHQGRPGSTLPSPNPSASGTLESPPWLASSDSEAREARGSKKSLVGRGFYGREKDLSILLGEDPSEGSFQLGPPVVPFLTLFWGRVPLN